jgi:hypothetical protein
VVRRTAVTSSAKTFAYREFWRSLPNNLHYYLL